MEPFPESHKIFEPLIADPREVQLSADYYRLNGTDSADVALGHSWGMQRWQMGAGWTAQWDIEGLAYSRFKLSGGINEFETVDFLANLPLEIRRGSFSDKFAVFHQSSHLGDDYIRDTRNLGFRYSVEGIRNTLSWDALQGVRLYGGGAYLMHSIPARQRGTLQAGFELKGPPLARIENSWAWLYLAQDFQSHENAQWNVNSETAVGIKFQSPSSPRAMRLEFRYFDGHSPFGQFYLRREHYGALAFVFDL